MNDDIRIQTMKPKERALIVTSIAEVSRSIQRSSHPNIPWLQATVALEQRAVDIEKDFDKLDLGISDVKGMLDPKNFAKEKETELNKEMTDITAQIGVIEGMLKGCDDEVFRLLFLYTSYE